MAVQGLRKLKVRQVLMAKPDLAWDSVKATLKARARAFEASAVLSDKHEPDVGSIKDDHRCL